MQVLKPLSATAPSLRDRLWLCPPFLEISYRCYLVILDPKNNQPDDIYKIMIGSITPRPIAFVSTISKDGIYKLHKLWKKNGSDIFLRLAIMLTGYD